MEKLVLIFHDLRIQRDAVDRTYFHALRLVEMADTLCA
jgi:hypothetical protein